MGRKKAEKAEITPKGKKKVAKAEKVATTPEVRNPVKVEEKVEKTKETAYVARDGFYLIKALKKYDSLDINMVAGDQRYIPEARAKRMLEFGPSWFVRLA